ncbi:MAG: PilZ domain-containing protein [Actinomycetota bacterium]
MNFGAKHIDRLLPRHRAEGDVTLEWNVRMARTGLFKKEERSATAVIRDLSLEGALVEVHDGAAHEPGDEVIVRFDGLEGTATVRHAQADGDTVLYGVRFTPETEFNAAIDLAVGALRGHSAELSAAWHRQN